MTNEDPDFTGDVPPRRSPRQSIGGGAPTASTLSIVLAVVAVLVGFLILNNISDDDGSGVATAPVDSVVDTVDSLPSSTVPPSTAPERVTDGATVLVANASGVGGSAGRMTSELEALGYTMGTAANATVSLTESVIYYNPSIASAQTVAESVALDMGGLTVEEVPSPVPVEGASLNGAGVLVMLGTDTADNTIEELNPAGNVAAPAVAGQTSDDAATDDSVTSDDSPTSDDG